jgi:transcription elongation factor GreA
VGFQYTSGIDYSLREESENIQKAFYSYIMEIKGELEDYYVKLEKEEEAFKYAKSLGDLSENADINIAMDNIYELKKIIDETKNEIQLYEQFQLSYTPTGIVEIGSTVRLQYDGKKIVVKIAADDISNQWINLIAANCPVGKAIIGKKAGDEAEATTPTRTNRLLIEGVY